MREKADHRQGLSLLELSLSKLILGTCLVVGKLVASTFPVFFASGITLGLVSLVFILLCLAKEKRIALPRPTDLAILALQSITGIFLFRISNLYGLRLTTAVAGGIIFSATPALIGLFSFLFLGERLDRTRILGIVAAVIGVAIINISRAKGDAGGANPLLGNLLLLGTACADALFTIFRKILTPRVSALANSAYVTSISFVLFIPFIFVEGSRMDFTSIPTSAWLLLFYFGTLGPFFSFFLWFSGLKWIEASVAALLTGFVPLGSMLLGALWLGEAVLPVHLLGAAVIVTGIFLGVPRGGLKPARRAESGAS